jgi:hypothetical protein
LKSKGGYIGRNEDPVKELWVEARYGGIEVEDTSREDSG